MDLFNYSGAIFDGTGQYRYSLWRIWDPDKPLVMFIGLNPSTADQENDDPTIRRVRNFAVSWGYGGVYMMNLFAYVTAYPDILKQAADPIRDNDKWLTDISGKCQDIIFSWGAFSEAKQRAKEVIKMFPDALAISINKDGSPGHPLYLKSDLKPIKYTTNERS